ncbi:MAG TPA: heme exporter protein CcmB [Spongiibacteraceae bacterium]|nr:heme exporter protein CcmB [Spongiibacteraceae bacterium]HCS28706.1 heme exporter protein CcmB [Spongiibacteraceae bacterium]|tara:strand:- start:3159 stop:3845 length:687 start_codon:yes stop_codon:yes gene_type:complete
MNPLTLTGLCRALLRRELTVMLRSRAELANPLFFFLMVCALFPLGLGPSPQLLATMAPGILWIVALLSVLMASDSLFRSDFEDGTLEQVLLSPVSLYLIVLIKTLGHWLLTGLPLTLLAPLLALMLQMPSSGLVVLVLSLAAGSLVLSFIAAIGAALTVGLKRGGVLLSLLVLPLFVPVLIFGSAAVQRAVQGMDSVSPLALLAAMALLSLALAPLAIAGALRVSLDQ